MNTSKIFEERNCLICGSSDYKIIYKSKTNVVKCLKCGFTYANPGIRDDANLNSILQHEDKDIKRYNALKNYQVPRFNAELEKMEKIIKPGRILDIGCGNGNFLECAKKRGWETYGIDLNPASYTPCSEHGEIFIGTLEQANYHDNYFDVIFSSSTFYYIIHLIEFLKEINRILKPGGLTVITAIPNVNSLDAYIKLESLYKPYPPEQVSYYFSKKDLIKIIKKSGFEIYSLKSSGFGISLSSMPEKSTGETSNKEFSTEIASLSKAASKGIIKSTVKPIVNSLLNLFNLGYSYTLYCRKPTE